MGGWATMISLWFGEVGLFSIGCEKGVADRMVNGLISELLGFMCYWSLIHQGRFRIVEMVTP